jgi:hypothetical protein
MVLQSLLASTNGIETQLAPCARRSQNADYGEFTVSVPPDGVGPAQVMVRNADVQVFVVVRYSM